MEKFQILTLLVLMTSGMAAAQPADIPGAGMTPGDLFYGLERASERLELAVASAPVIGSDELAAKVRANHAAERLAEARELATENRTEKVDQLMQQYSQNMNRSFQTARNSGNQAFTERLENVSNNQVKVLQDVQKKVPEQAKASIQKAIENSKKSGSRRKNNNLPGTPDQKIPSNKTSEAARKSSGNKTGAGIEGKTGDMSTGIKDALNNSSTSANLEKRVNSSTSEGERTLDESENTTPDKSKPEKSLTNEAQEPVSETDKPENTGIP